jgi:hypothetical protein
LRASSGFVERGVVIHHESHADSSQLNLLDPATHERLASIVQVVGRKATNQTMRYSDNRTAPDLDLVTPEGLRLRRGITAGVVVAVLHVALRLFATLHGL